jgi:geranylgeranyl pyrophosphate synthase
MHLIESEKLELYKNQINQFICDFVDSLSFDNDGKTIYEMLKYTLINDSKKLRAIFILLFGEILEIPTDVLRNYCIAIEVMHTYTLVHDDLPAIDNDAVRRGRPTAHKAFGHANAILLGDGLNTMAFELFASKNSYFVSEGILDAVWRFAKTMGLINGVVYGQFLDINNSENDINEEEILKIHKYKTAIFFGFCCSLPAILSQKSKESIEDCYDFGLKFGMLFQFLDDIDDFNDKKSEINICNAIGFEIAKDRYKRLLNDFISTNKFPQLNIVIKKLLNLVD